MSDPAHRRTISELDMSSMRRISDALLLAQNRARRATERANQAEHILNLVLSQVNVRRLRVGSLSDLELLRGIVASDPLLNRRSNNMLKLHDATNVFFGTATSQCLNDVSKEVVSNLKAAMNFHKRYVKQVEPLTIPLSMISYTDGVFLNSVFCVAGFLAGVFMGIALTKHWQLRGIYTQKKKCSLIGKLVKWHSCRQRVVNTPWHLIPVTTDDYNYIMNPIIEVE